jgi:hypothetical protein
MIVDPSRQALINRVVPALQGCPADPVIMSRQYDVATFMVEYDDARRGQDPLYLDSIPWIPGVNTLTYVSSHAPHYIQSDDFLRTMDLIDTMASFDANGGKGTGYTTYRVKLDPS